MTSGKDMRALARPTSAMHYRLADNLDIDALCRQPLRLQKIHDRNGHTIILAVSADQTVTTLAYGVQPRMRRPATPPQGHEGSPVPTASMNGEREQLHDEWVMRMWLVRKGKR
jgi:hypothetical protein